MSRRSGKAKDFTVTARRVMERAIGEHLDGTPLETPATPSRNAAFGRLGGQKGGLARAKKLSRKRRHDIAKKAAMTRWSKTKKR